ncbi:uncharacterized protein LOC141581851 [Saimiri boliviensis]|uniref:uncharacterized protein LOC141581851 n=1 Tax=Saimiri boliviensis TaxID=27679 RepID=UPI003D7790E3
MVGGWLLLSGAVLLLLPGGEEGADTQRKRGRDYCPKPPAADCLRRPSLLPKSARSRPRLSRVPAVRPGRRVEGLGPGDGGSVGAHGLSRSRAPCLLLCYFPGLPRTPSCLASIARNERRCRDFPQCNCRGRYFLAYGSRRFPTPRGGGQVGAGGGGGGDGGSASTEECSVRNAATEGSKRKSTSESTQKMRPCYRELVNFLLLPMRFPEL